MILFFKWGLKNSFLSSNVIAHREIRWPISSLLTVFVRFAIKWHIDFHKARIKWAVKYIQLQPLTQQHRNGWNLMELIGPKVVDVNSYFKHATHTHHWSCRRLTKQDIVFIWRSHSSESQRALGRWLSKTQLASSWRQDFLFKNHTASADTHSNGRGHFCH